jgi:hypothetical protein
MEKTKFQSRINEIEAAQRKKQAQELVQGLAESWGKGLVPRGQIKAFTGGLYKSAYMANLDCVGEGPGGAFKIGRQVVYPLANLTEWLIARIEV